MGAIATFNYEAWVALFPEFASVQGAQAQLYWNIATGYLDNTGCGRVPDVPTQTTLLNLLTAHIATLLATSTSANGQTQPASTLVGRISQAAEGSVNVSAEFDANGSPSEAFFLQTKYGTMYWQMVKPYWQGPQYRPHPTFIPTAIFPSI